MEDWVDDLGDVAIGAITLAISGLAVLVLRRYWDMALFLAAIGVCIAFVVFICGLVGAVVRYTIRRTRG